MGIAPVVFGALAQGGKSARRDEASRIATMRAAVAAGVNAIDTAPIYDLGRSEELVGRILREHPGVLAFTKVGLRWDDPRGELLFHLPDDHGGRRAIRKNGRPDSIRVEVERSLRRLGVETIDLVQVHVPDPATPIADTMGALLDLRREGKLRAIGASNFNASMIREAQRALGDVPLASVQEEYSALYREIEGEVLPLARELDIGVLAYSPLMKGLLSGKSRPYADDDYRGMNALFKPSNRARIRSAIEWAVKPISDLRGAKISQVMIAWLLAQPGLTAVIAGARTPEQARENAAAAMLELTPDEVGRIRAVFEGLVLDLRPDLRSRLAPVRMVRRAIARARAFFLE